jgi:hypothetical protein
MSKYFERIKYFERMYANRATDTSTLCAHLCSMKIFIRILMKVSEVAVMQN